MGGDGIEPPTPSDDYVTKPFHYAELLAGIGSLLKRVSRVANRDQLRVGDPVVNTASKQVTVARRGRVRPCGLGCLRADHRHPREKAATERSSLCPRRRLVR